MPSFPFISRLPSPPLTSIGPQQAIDMPHPLQSSLILLLAGISDAASIPPHLQARQHGGDHQWHGGFSPHHGYPGGKGHGTYGDWPHDNYYGWQHHQGYPPSYGGGQAIEVPASTPPEACPPVDPDFIGFAFEQASFVPYVQNRDGSVNQYSLNLIDAIMSRTGGKPIIRLGGTSADYAKYLPGQEEPALPVAEVDNYQQFPGTTIGPKYWELTANVPNAVYVVQLPLAQTNVSETVAWAQSSAELIGIDRIQAFEPGNEPDLYPIAELVPPEYQGELTNETYTGNFTKYVDAIKEAVDIPESPFFQAFDTAAHLGDDVLATGYILDVETNFDLGINDGGDVKTVASHYYQTDGGEYEDLGPGLMNHSAIAMRLDLLRKFITYLAGNHPEIPYIISEVGNSLNPTYSYDYQAVLGSALWQVDFQLYCMSIGIARINWQQIMHSGYDMWLPIDSANQTRKTYSNFYAMPFVGDFIGVGGGSQAVQLDTGVENVVAYASYADGTPARIAIVNLNIWDEGDTTERPSETLTFALPDGVSEINVDVLNSPQGAHARGDSITYAGSQWTSESNGEEVKGVREDSYTIQVENGKAELSVEKSTAVLLHLK